MALWSVAPGRDDGRAEYGFEPGLTLLAWSRADDLRRARSRRDLRRALRAAYPTLPAAAIARGADQLWRFVREVHEGDLVATPLTRRPEVAFGRVTGPYRFEPAAPEGRRHQRPVSWLRQTPLDRLDPRLRAELEATTGLHRVGRCLLYTSPSPRD